MMFRKNDNCNKDPYGCPDGVCPDFFIKRFDTMPSFRVRIEDCDNSFIDSEEEYDHLVLETNMWANAKLKNKISIDDTVIFFADNIGFNQVRKDDIIVFNDSTFPENVLVQHVDESFNQIFILRGYNGTIPSSHKKGSSVKIYRSLNHNSEIEIIKKDILQVDGSVENKIVDTFFVHNWTSSQTCLPGCYWMEFKLIRMYSEEEMMEMNEENNNNSENGDPISEILISDISYSPNDIYCNLGSGVKWVRRFPVGEQGFLIKIFNTPTFEF